MRAATIATAFVYFMACGLGSAQEPKELLLLKGHKRNVTSVAFSADGKFIVSAADDQAIRVWDAKEGTSRHTIRKHKGDAPRIAISPDGKRVASAARDIPGHASIWLLTTGEVVLTLKGHDSFLSDVAFSPDGTRIATASADKTARQWDAATGKELTSEIHKISCGCVRYCPIGALLATFDGDLSAKLWEVSANKSKELFTLPHRERVVWLDFSRDGKLLVTCTISGLVGPDITIWDCLTGKAARSFKPDDAKHISRALFSPCGNFVVTSETAKLKTIVKGARTEGAIRVRDAVKWTTLRTIGGFGDTGGHFICFSPDGHRFAAVRETQILGWETANLLPKR